MIYGYARVSTKGQAKDGNSLESQEKIYSDSSSGTKIDRPQLDELLSKLQDGDTLIVTKLDRIARSMTQGSKLVNELIGKGVKVHILNIGIMDNTPSSKLIRNIFFSFAEYERDMIVERTQEGKTVARTKNGFKEGRPKKYTETQLKMAIDLLKVHSYTDVERMTTISKSTLIREVRKIKSEQEK